MAKKTKSTLEKFLESLSPEERKKIDEEYREFLLSELILAAMAKDTVSVRNLAKMAGLFPNIKNMKTKSFIEHFHGSIS